MCLKSLPDQVLQVAFNSLYIVAVTFSFILCSYDKGAHLFLPSYVMRTHGAKQQRDAVKRTSRRQLEPVFEVCKRVRFAE